MSQRSDVLPNDELTFCFERAAERLGGSASVGGLSSTSGGSGQNRAKGGGGGGGADFDFEDAAGGG